MPFIVINTSNNFDPVHQSEFATEEQADAAAREILAAQPGAVVRTAQLLKRYTARVTVTAKVAEAAEPTAQEGV
ncbi:MAG TPA: hypothetical protein VJS90_07815 [Pseudomonas sp.]|uniref:hypothetical protein n=1 Tax=Pseudomonas sp. TaxID=306 RepID=UPI002B48E2DA|nr:hypothetical protein [Pseudomonas sp.]HKS12934.1 hypothetical protein [Pseudomonas sp.]